MGVATGNPIAFVRNLIETATATGEQVRTQALAWLDALIPTLTTDPRQQAIAANAAWAYFQAVRIQVVLASTSLGGMETGRLTREYEHWDRMFGKCCRLIGIRSMDGKEPRAAGSGAIFSPPREGRPTETAKSASSQTEEVAA